MSEWSPAKEVERRLAAIERYDADGQADTRELAPILIGLLDWIAENPGESSAFEDVFVDYVDRNKTTEVLEFCMHHLRYPRVRERVEQIRDRAPATGHGFDTRNWAERILSAYSDDWEDVRIGLWPRYQRPSHSA